jgi:hypothetical protein
MHGTSVERGKPALLLMQGKWTVRPTRSMAGTGGGKKRTLAGNQPDRDCEIISRESGQTQRETMAQPSLEGAKRSLPCLSPEDHQNYRMAQSSPSLAIQRRIR